jgi:hypothetical protein
VGELDPRRSNLRSGRHISVSRRPTSRADFSQTLLCSQCRLYRKRRFGRKLCQWLFFDRTRTDKAAIGPDDERDEENARREAMSVAYLLAKAMVRHGLCRFLRMSTRFTGAIFLTKITTRRRIVVITLASVGNNRAKLPKLTPMKPPNDFAGSTVAFGRRRPNRSLRQLLTIVFHRVIIQKSSTYLCQWFGPGDESRHRSAGPLVYCRQDRKITRG